MAKGKKNCSKCNCQLTNQNRNNFLKHLGWDLVQIPCCNSCYHKLEKGIIK